MERKPAVADTGFVVALLNRLDIMHRSVTTVYTQPEQILLPQTVLAEVAYQGSFPEMEKAYNSFGANNFPYFYHTKKVLSTC